MYNQEELQSKRVPELHKMIKAEGVTYKVYSKMIKKEIINHLVNETLAKDIPTNELTHEEVDSHVNDFVSKGGTIQVGPSPRDPKVRPPTERSAISAKGPKKRKTCTSLFEDDETEAPVARKKAKKTKKTKSAPERKASVAGEVTLQSICDELGITPYLARKILRTASITKPGKQWVWEKGSPGIKTVKKLLQSK